MNRFRYIVASLIHHWRVNLALALGVAVATAVLTGALLVGDSVRGSLRDLALGRLGKIDELLVTPQFFRVELAEELSANKDFSEDFSATVPAITVQGTVEKPDTESTTRAGGVTVIGCMESFWQLGDASLPKLPAGREVILNRPLATELEVAVGDDVIIRLGDESEIPADSALGRKHSAARSIRLTVVDIIAAEGLGRFGLSPTQQLPHNAYVDLKTLQQLLEQPDKANAIFVAGRDPDSPPTNREHQRLQGMLKPKLIDYGLEIEKTERGYFNLTSRGMLLDEAIVTAATKAFEADEFQPAYTYLANTIAKGGREIPYSTITAVDCNPTLGPVFNVGECLWLGDNEIVFNRWAADDLDAKVGDEIAVTFFDPETTHGETVERTEVFTLKAIMNLSGRAADPDFTPELVGITDQLSLGEWDPPFPYDSKRIRQKDEDYWDDHRTTPKAFISLAVGRRLWDSRFGDTTSLRFVADGDTTREQIIKRLDLRPADLGFEFMPIRQHSLRAAQGTTPFDLLFLGFSFFLIAAALMLVALLFRMSVEQRAAEMGTLLAMGVGRQTVGKMLLREGMLVSIDGAIVGTVLGIGYAWLMLAGLRTWWLEAIVTPFLFLHVTWQSLVLGAVLGFLCVCVTMFWAYRRMSRLPLVKLLAGKYETDSFAPEQKRPWRRVVALGLIALAVALGLVAVRLGGEAQAGAFFGAGAMVLAAALLELGRQLRERDARSARNTSPGLTRLAIASAARNPSRSVLTVGLVASASFLIVAISAFRLDPTAAGAGGFSIIAQSDRPIFANLDDPTALERFDFPENEQQRIAKCRVASLRVNAGDDASCLNLYQPRQPRVVGVPNDAIKLFESPDRTHFAWAATGAENDEEKANPWLLLNARSVGKEDAPIPVVLDMNTAMYSLHLWNGVGSVFSIENEAGKSIDLLVVGLLKNSIFQGDILMGENVFEHEFPDVSGYQLFLVDTRGASEDTVASSLEQSLGDFGLDAQSTQQRLASLLAVQNTYLSTFQSLGGLGLLLGTLGLAVVQLRSALERRGEFALMRAAGFRRATLARMVLIENVLLLAGGLAIGLVAALVAVLPHLIAGGASIPWLSLTTTLVVVAIVGFAAGSLAMRVAVRAPIVAALRGD